MSVWSDMENRGTGDLLKKEDDYMSLDKIYSYLKSLEVGVGKEAPIRIFFIVAEDMKLHTMTLQSMMFSDGSRHYGSSMNLDKFNNFITTIGRIKSLI